jgi:hypothetical protein
VSPPSTSALEADCLNFKGGLPLLRLVELRLRVHWVDVKQQVTFFHEVALAHVARAYDARLGGLHELVLRLGDCLPEPRTTLSSSVTAAHITMIAMSVITRAGGLRIRCAACPPFPRELLKFYVGHFFLTFFQTKLLGRLVGDDWPFSKTNTRSTIVRIGFRCVTMSIVLPTLPPAGPRPLSSPTPGPSNSSARRAAVCWGRGGGCARG